MDAPFKTPGSGGGKKKDNKKVLLLAVGGIIVVVLVLMRRPAASNPDAPTAYVADSYEQFGQPNGGIDRGMSGEEVDGRVTQALNSAMAALESDNNSMMNGYFQTTNDYLKDRDEEYLKVIGGLAEQNKKYNDDLIARDKADKAAADAQKKLDAKQDAELKKQREANKKQEAELKKQREANKRLEEQIKKDAKKTDDKKKTETKKTTTTKTALVKVNYSGNSIVDGLKKAGISSTMSNRAEIAAGNGIKNYTGTAAQNTQLLNKAKAGTLKITPSMRK